MTRTECVQKYGRDGFRYLKVAENGTDRADIDSVFRSTDGFVELRVSVPGGKILGATICSPGASDIANEIGVAIMNKLSCRDIARCIHAYPSYSYLMHRVALALALSDIWGQLAACGPIGRLTGSIGRTMQGCISKILKKKSKRIRKWESLGSNQEMDCTLPINNIDNSMADMASFSGTSFLEASENLELVENIKDYLLKNKDDKILPEEKKVLTEFLNWLNSKPK